MITIFKASKQEYIEAFKNLLIDNLSEEKKEYNVEKYKTISSKFIPGPETINIVLKFLYDKILENINSDTNCENLFMVNKLILTQRLILEINRILILITTNIKIGTENRILLLDTMNIVYFKKTMIFSIYIILEMMFSLYLYSHKNHLFIVVIILITILQILQILQILRTVYQLRCTYYAYNKNNGYNKKLIKSKITPIKDIHLSSTAKLKYDFYNINYTENIIYKMQDIRTKNETNTTLKEILEAFPNKMKQYDNEEKKNTILKNIQ